MGVLYDSTRCIGCRECVIGCAEANGWDPDLALGSESALSDECRTVLRQVSVAESSSSCFLKVQCMHCVHPACVSACMLGAMSKDEDGAVVWNPELCVGCRYCQIACPFQVPRFEWDTPTPRLLKCELCPERRAQGLAPACVEQCRRGALVYGKRSELIEEARARMAANPGRYNAKVFGEHDGGGTSVMYMAAAGVSFTDMGLPELGDESPAALPENIQHTLYKGFAAPLALFATAGAIVRRNSRRLHEEEEKKYDTHKSAPVGGSLFTPTTAVLAALTVIGVFTVVYRYLAGLGATTNLNDGYPMGIWIAFDVVTGTALACGGYAMALLVYLANRGKYHPLVRSALVTSAFGYTLGGLSVLVDIGRPWNFYRIPTFFWEWNFNSILLEVALCIMLYTTVLWIEVLPIFLEQWKDSRIGRLRSMAVAVSPKLEKALPYFIALGMVLPTMHQSSLGSFMLMAGVKVHALWSTPLLPLLFLVSCVAMGYAAVTLECCISARAFKRPSETPVLRALGLPISMVLLAYVVLRLADVVQQGKVGLITQMDGFSVLFLVEMALFTVPALALLIARKKAPAGLLVALAVMVVGGGALYRFSTFLFAYRPGPQWSYFPSLAEIAVTVGFVAAEILGYIILVKRFPILRGIAASGEPADCSAPGTDEPQHSLPVALLDPVPGADDDVEDEWSETEEEDLHVLA